MSTLIRVYRFKDFFLNEIPIKYENELVHLFHIYIERMEGPIVLNGLLGIRGNAVGVLFVVLLRRTPFECVAIPQAQHLRLRISLSVLLY